MARPKAKEKSTPPKLVDLADEVSKALHADVLFYNAPIERHLDQRVIELCAARRRRENIALFLITEGGSADAAYRIAAALQNSYKGQFIVFVSGFCKSAGTLVALGAHGLVMSTHGELGPLDVQLTQKDELLETRSGLTATSALRTLNEQAFQAFEHFLIETQRRSFGAISTKTAAEIATRMACGLFTPVYQQVDPMHIGEAGRALKIAQDYGRRLALVGKNLKGELEDALEHLVSHYPSHGFVIDYREATKIFKQVRLFSQTEMELVRCLGPMGRWPTQREEEAVVTFLSSEKIVRKPKAKERSENAGQKEPRSTATARAGTRATAAAGRDGQPVLPEIARIGRVSRRP